MHSLKTGRYRCSLPSRWLHSLHSPRFWSCSCTEVADGNLSTFFYQLYIFLVIQNGNRDDLCHPYRAILNFYFFYKRSCFRGKNQRFTKFLHWCCLFCIVLFDIYVEFIKAVHQKLVFISLENFTKWKIGWHLAESLTCYQQYFNFLII